MREFSQTTFIEFCTRIHWLSYWDDWIRDRRFLKRKWWMLWNILCRHHSQMHGLSGTYADRPTLKPSPDNNFTCPAPRPSVDGSAPGDDKWYTYFEAVSSDSAIVCWNFVFRLKAWIAEFKQSELLGSVLAELVENGDNAVAVWDSLAKAMMNAHDEL